MLQLDRSGLFTARMANLQPSTTKVCAIAPGFCMGVDGAGLV